MDSIIMTKTTQEPTYTNRLARETSPYLLQHAHNPVDWYPWGPEALERAISEEKPILLSIGYSACHWCHVMERESFENPEIAKLMNERFVCIKVDREERPDLDSIYMAATVTLNQGRGGWPMTVFLTPQQQPFFAGTYFPPEEKQGQPGFPTILQALSNAWTQDRKGILEQATNLTTHLMRAEAENRFRTIGPEELTRAAQQLEQSFDGIYGGFSPAPKFPAAAAISLLLRRYRSHNDKNALHMATLTLDRMALGGIYDHLGGGFARYSTDEKWLVPHFEKMLYDNALLIRAYCEAWQITRSPLYARVIRETLDFVLREMTQDSGGFSSALDADTEGREGLYYIWEKSELSSHLNEEDAALFAELYGVIEDGNWESSNVLHLQRSLEDEAQKRKIEDVSAFVEKVDSLRSTLLKARTTRTQPATDDKVLTSWNGMMIGAMALGFQVTGDERYLNAAINAANFIEHNLTHKGQLLRTYRDGKAHLNAYLEDYAHVSEALIDLYEASGDGQFLTRAAKTLETMLRDFGEPGGGSLYMTASNHEALILRKREGYDGATPSPNAVAAMALLRAAAHLGREDFNHEGLAAVEAWGQSITEMPRAFSKILHAVDFVLEGPTQIAITGEDQKERRGLIQSVHQAFTPNAIVAWEHAYTNDMESYNGHPLLDNRTGQTQPQVHVCRDFTCTSPATTPEGVSQNLTQSLPKTRFATLRRPIEGMASAAATRSRAETCFPTESLKSLGKTNLTVTPVGFGSYRVIDEEESHRQALEDALRAGINLIDTSTNYSDGRSERLIGRVLSNMIRAGALTREEVIVVSKVGYIQGRNLTNVKKRSEPFKDVVEFNDSLWHCIHPDFIKEQISESTQRLSLKTLDICLLHNPEYFLLHAQRVGGGTRPQLVDEMQRRIKEAFVQLEKEREAGRIGYYGISSNTFADKGQSFTTLSISQCMDIAHEVAGEEHGFRVIQLPFNLIEAGALCERNTGINTAETPLEYAQSQSLGVLANRPLNAIVDGSIVRLATPSPSEPPLPYSEALTNLHSLEQELRARITGEVYLGGESLKLEDFFYFAVEFEDYGNQSHNKTSWDEIEYRIVNQRLNRMVEFMQKNLQDGSAKAWQTIFPDYRKALTLALEALRHRADQVSLSQAATISDALKTAIPADHQDAPLSQKALWLTQNVDGISSVLCGMRTPEYVGDVLALKNWKPQPTPPEVFESLSQIEKALNQST